ncbi:MAG: MmcQ/YjbR family DNA-binding protein [Frankiales bacterium]|nr:MmcQ/YjbR family DNA-binding protein [Frankiales bacterium]
MATWDDVERIARGLPEVDEAPTGHDGLRGWRVRGKRNLVWERPLRPRDVRELEELGGVAPDGPVLGVRVPDLDSKDARLAEDPDAVFTVPHFDGYAAVLVRLDEIDVADLEDLITDAWVHLAPKRVVAAWQGSRAD